MCFLGNVIKFTSRECKEMVFWLNSFSNGIYLAQYEIVMVFFLRVHTLIIVKFFVFSYAYLSRSSTFSFVSCFRLISMSTSLCYSSVYFSRSSRLSFLSCFRLISLSTSLYSSSVISSCLSAFSFLSKNWQDHNYFPMFCPFLKCLHIHQQIFDCILWGKKMLTNIKR